MSSSLSTPPVSAELLEFLQGKYPDRCPSVDTPDRKVWVQAGAAAVVRYLEILRKEQVDGGITGFPSQ